jgi:hypothetical protein
MPTSYLETRCNYKKTLPGGKVEEVIAATEDKFNEEVEESKEKNDGTTLELVHAQSLRFHEVSIEQPIEDFLLFCDNKEEQANLINRAIILKQQQYVRRLMTDSNWVPVDGELDLAFVIPAISERKSATPEQKAANALSKMLGRTVSQDELANIIASLGAPQSA